MMALIEKRFYVTTTHFGNQINQQIAEYLKFNFLCSRIVKKVKFSFLKRFFPKKCVFKAGDLTMPPYAADLIVFSCCPNMFSMC